MTAQKTVKNPVEIEGTGLQTGCKTKIILKGAPADSGIVFLRTDLDGRPPISIRDISLDYCGLGKRRTTLKKGRAERCGPSLRLE